jgi:hypothetical protein
MLVSIRVERWSAEKSVSSELARRWARDANVASYAPIISVLVVLAALDWLRSP